ncbi:MAG: GntR family transcriptional regulator [Rhodospirillales bacterium]|nr:GntR family transcriptional regulator [Rhodospirillales bacterium]
MQDGPPTRAKEDPAGPAPGPSRLNVSAILATEIARGIYPVGGRFPTEFDLQARFAVGRHSIREALKILTEQGLIGRKRKTGSVVLSAEPVSHYAHSLRDMRGLLDFADSTTLDVRHHGFVMVSTAQTTQFLPDPGRRWFRVAGLRSTKSDDAALCWAEIFVADKYVPNREELVATEGPIYERVMAINSLKLGYVDQEIRATTLEPGMAMLLGVEPKSAALLVKRRYVAHTGDTYEISYNLYPADRYSVRSVIRQRA